MVMSEWAGGCIFACVESSLLWLSQGGIDQYSNVSFLIKSYFHGLLNKFKKTKHKSTLKLYYQC